tara:strand:+ start:120 stop:239 length:120 start_codon:yes stop_codon:yes gene_type:complete
MQGTIKSFEELMEYNLELKKQEREAEKELNKNNRNYEKK